MKVLVLGATGYIGSVLRERLAGRGHEVVALVRPKARDTAVPGEVRHGDLYEPETLKSAVTPDIDVVVHAANPTGDEEVDVAAIEALAGGGARLVYISGVWVLGATTEAAGEDAPVNPITPSRYRTRVERLVLAMEKAAPGSLFHAVAEEAVSVADVAAAAGRTGRAVPWPLDEAGEVLGRPFAEGLALSQVVSGDLARKVLGWRPSRPGLLDDVRSGSYASRA